MARRFTLELIMDLATSIGANPGKAISRSNISFLGKGPQKNPLFQERLAGLENATTANLGKPETLFAAIEDAVGWAKDGKLNSIQTEILGHNLLGIDNILHPPVLPMARITDMATRTRNLTKEGLGALRAKTGDTPLTVTPPRSYKGGPRPLERGVMIDSKGNPIRDTEWAKRFPKETHKFMGRPLKDKDFSEIDRMIMEGKIPDARGRTWNLKVPETGPERYNRLTGLDKNKPFQGWTPSVVPKVNIPASKINHQIIADKYGIDVELIRGKDWVEVLEVIRKLGYAKGGLAEIMQTPRRGRVVHPGGYAGSKRQAFMDLAARGGSRQDFINLANSFRGIKPPVHDPLEQLMIHEMLMSGALPSELKHGGLARILEV